MPRLKTQFTDEWLLLNLRTLHDQNPHFPLNAKQSAFLLNRAVKTLADWRNTTPPRVPPKFIQEGMTFYYKVSEVVKAIKEVREFENNEEYEVYSKEQKQLAGDIARGYVTADVMKFDSYPDFMNRGTLDNVWIFAKVPGRPPLEFISSLTLSYTEEEVQGMEFVLMTKEDYLEELTTFGKYQKCEAEKEELRACLPDLPSLPRKPL